MAAVLDDVGTLSVSASGGLVIWTIRDYLQLDKTGCVSINSPYFYFETRRWNFRLYPRCSWPPAGTFGEKSVFEICFSISGDKAEGYIVKHHFIGNYGGQFFSGTTRLYTTVETNDLLRSDFMSKLDEILYAGVLTICFVIRNIENIPRVVRSLQAKPEPNTNVEKAAGCTCVEAFTQTEAELGKLQQDLEELLISGLNSDVTVKLQDKDFHVHRSLLAARSPVFSAMLESEMKEKATGIITIKDSDPDTFPHFLHYLYTGSVKTLAFEKVLNLYTTADKYQVDGLKRICVNYLMKNVSVENFCDVMALSLRHHEKEVIDVATRFFLQNSLDIVVTVKWQLFLAEHTVAGNELFIKSLQLQKPQK